MSSAVLVLFALRLSRQMYRNYQEQIVACGLEEIEKMLARFPARVESDDRPLAPDRKQKQRRSRSKTVNPRTGFNARTDSYKLFGVDLMQIPGVARIALVLFTEVGRDVSQGRTAAGWHCVPTTTLGGQGVVARRAPSAQSGGAVVPAGGARAGIVARTSASRNAASPDVQATLELPMGPVKNTLVPARSVGWF